MEYKDIGEIENIYGKYQKVIDILENQLNPVLRIDIFRPYLME